MNDLLLDISNSLFYFSLFSIKSEDIFKNHKIHPKVMKILKHYEK